MTVWGSKSELAHAPRLVAWLLQDLATHSGGSFMEGVNIVHVQVRDVAVIAELSRAGHVRAPAEHERDVARTTEPPVAGGDVVDVAAENIPIPRTRTLKIMNRENWIRARDPHSAILTWRGRQWVRRLREPTLPQRARAPSPRQWEKSAAVRTAKAVVS